MCGRFVRYSSPETFAELLEARGAPNLAPSYNVAPSQSVLVARNDEGGEDPKPPYSTINARAETVHTKPAFRHAIRHRRCLIGSDGYYEWQKLERIPYFIRLKDAAPFAFAGLWEHWERGEERIDSCSIIVTDAAEALRDIHDRMPVILSPEHYDTWMDPELADPVQLKPLLAPYPSELMEAYPVSTRVNSPKNNHADLIVRMPLPLTGYHRPVTTR